MSRPPRVAACAATILLSGLFPTQATAQATANGGHVPDSVTIVAGPRYQKPALYRWLFGGAYRALWLTPIRVPVLNLGTFDGGLVADELGGGNATLSLRFDSEDGSRYVFRTVDKEPLVLPAFARGGFPRDVARDRTASTHPAANLIHAPFYEAGGIIHDDDAQLFVLPDDERLGEWREQLAGRLGVLTRFPGKEPQLVAEYASAIEIVDSDTLLQRMNRDPGERVDPTQYLTARLVDMLLNSWDRHPGQWKWARLTPGGDWQPVSRDMDNVLVSQDGFLPKLAQVATPMALTFDSGYPSMRSLLFKSIDLDRRFLAGTTRSVFDSVATSLRARITDAVIAASMARMPVEYATSQPVLEAKLRMRRDSLPMIASRFYGYLAEMVDIHATDAAERATISRVDAEHVDVRIERPDGSTWYTRRFDARETQAIRLYLHGGDDQATVVGDVPSSIPLQIIGGNGTNRLVDSSRVDGHRDRAGLHDVGTVDDVDYGLDTQFNRRPLVAASGGLVMAGRDFGTGIGPTAGLTLNRDMGVMPRVGVTWRRYGFRSTPYDAMVALEARYSFKNAGVFVSLSADKRRAGTRVHYTALAQMSELELLNYHGLGNASPATAGLPAGGSAPRTDFYAVQHQQWLLHPAVAYALGPTADVRLGPVLEYTATSGTPGGFLASSAPYGAGRFGMAGMRLSLSQDGRDRQRHPRRGTVVEVKGDYFPPLWDVRSAFGSITALAGAYVTLPVPLRPYLGLRGGARKVFGDFPFHEAAFLGGRAGVRTLDPQRYAGDASLTAKAELRIPVATFALFLPLNAGLFAAQEIGRVYLKGESPGGWHRASSAGFWVGFHDLTVDIRLIQSNQVGGAPLVALQVGHSGMVP